MSQPVSSAAWKDTAFTAYRGSVGLVRSIAKRALSLSFVSETTRLASAVNRTAM